MRPNNNPRRQRGRNGGGGHGGGHKGGGKPQRNQTYDSNGPDVRVRGNAHQIFEKYQVLAREAAAAGDRIAAESYYQHAEHYLRLINAAGGFQQQRGPAWNDGETFEEGDNRGGDGRGEQRQQEGRGHGGANGYNGREERGYQGREQNGVDPEGDQPDLPVAAFPQNENS
ncbi:MAG: DUF4167 domain-containing protein [Reyranellaceae bacterium]